MRIIPCLYSVSSDHQFVHPSKDLGCATIRPNILSVWCHTLAAWVGSKTNFSKLVSGIFKTGFLFNIWSKMTHRFILNLDLNTSQAGPEKIV